MQNLYSLITAIKKIAQALPDVNTVVLSNVFELNSNPAIDYSVFAIVQDVHRQDDDYYYYSFFLYYIDRLLNDKSNVIQIHSHGINLISTVISKIEELGLIVNHDVVQTTYQTFTQRFSDECAGVFARVEIMVPVDCSIPYDVLVDPILADITITSGGTYNPADYGADGFKTVVVEGELPDIWVKKDPTKSDEIVNLNDLIETGYYYIPANKSTGAPIAWADAMLHTIKKTDEGISMIVQYYTTTVNDDNRYWPRTYFRSLGWNITQSAITWSAWHEVATTTNAYMTDAGYVVGSSAHTIDFNSFTQKGGYYFCRTNGYSANGPRGYLWDGILEVIMKFGGNGLQRYTEMLDGVPRTYIRYKNWDGWSGWYEYSLTPVNQQ